MRTRLFLILYFGLILLSFLLSSCSPQTQAHRLVRQAYAKLEKAQRLDPSVIDSIKSVREIDVIVPEDSGSVTITPEVDTTRHKRTMDSYDSAVLVNDSLNRLIQSGNLSSFAMEQALADQHRTMALLKRERDRLRNAFLKDSTYLLSDSLIDIRVKIVDSKFSGIDYKIKERTIKTKVETTDIHLDGSVVIKPWKQNWFWIMLSLILVLLLVILVLSRRK